MILRRFTCSKIASLIITLMIILSPYGQVLWAAEAPPRAIDLSPTAYSLGGYPRAAALVDLDNDRDMDIVVTNTRNRNVVILLNKGDAAFETGNSYPVEGYPISIAAADIDGDHDTDMMVLDSDGMVRTLINGGEGEFSAGGGYPVAGYSFSMTLSDVDRDLDTDIIVLSSEITTVLINDGKGGFKTRFSYKGGVNPVARITDDLNNDAEDDMVIGGSEGISVLLNNGDETFAKGVWYATGKMPLSAAAGNIDSDYDIDLVTANYKDNTVSILRNNGDGTFQEALNYPTGKGPNSITLGDIDRDEDPDIIVTNGHSGDITIFTNKTVRPLVITTGDLPRGTNGQYYETVLEAEGGVPPYTWSVASGSLPSSLHLDPSTGRLESMSHHGDDENPHPHFNPLPEGEEISLPFKGRDRVGMGFSDERIGDGQGSTGISREGGEPLLTFTPPCYCLKASVGLYRFTAQVADSSSHIVTADLAIEVLPGPGTISGRINYSGEKKGKVIIGLWPSITGGATMWVLGNPIYISDIDTPGEYKLEKLYPESYLISAFLDVNGDGRRQGDEPYGVFGAKEPEAILVNDGAVISDIDIELVDK